MRSVRRYVCDKEVWIKDIGQHEVGGGMWGARGTRRDRSIRDEQAAAHCSTAPPFLPSSLLRPPPSILPASHSITFLLECLLPKRTVRGV